MLVSSFVKQVAVADLTDVLRFVAIKNNHAPKWESDVWDDMAASNEAANGSYVSLNRKYASSNILEILDALELDELLVQFSW